MLPSPSQFGAEVVRCARVSDTSLPFQMHLIGIKPRELFSASTDKPTAPQGPYNTFAFVNVHEPFSTASAPSSPLDGVFWDPDAHEQIRHGEVRLLVSL